MSSTVITPNVVITSPDTRRKLGLALYILSVVAGVLALFFAFFPEVFPGTDVPTRVIAFINSVVSMLSGAFGLTVTLPNVPKSTSVSVPSVEVAPGETASVPTVQVTSGASPSVQVTTDATPLPKTSWSAEERAQAEAEAVAVDEFNTAVDSGRLRRDLKGE